MVKVTVEEAEEIIRTQITQRGNDSLNTLLSAWRIITDRIVERLEPWKNHGIQLPLAKRILQLWGDVLMPASVSRDAQYFFPGPDLQRLKNTYLELNAITSEVGHLSERLPFSDQPELGVAITCFEDVASFVHEAIGKISDYASQGTVTITAGGLAIITQHCRKLLSLVLGKQATDLFAEQYDQFIKVLTQFEQMRQLGRKAKN